MPALEETRGMNNKNFTTIHQLYGEKFGSRIQTIFLGEILSSCDTDYGDNGLSRHTLLCVSLLRPCITSTFHLHRAAQRILHHTKYKISIYSLLIFELYMFECQNIFLLILIYYIKILFTKFVNMQLLKHSTL